MLKFLILYLIVTGIGAFIALSMPGLVILGFFALIIPGLILSLMPTAFLYGLVFTIAWVAAQSVVGDLGGIVAGLAAVASLGTMIVKPTRDRDMAAYQASILPDVGAGEEIRLHGHVRFDLDKPRMNKTETPGFRYVAGEAGFACDGHCLAALFTPGVTYVTINSWAPDGRLSPEARTYSLQPRPACTASATVNFDALVLPFSGNYEASKLLKSQWAMKLANDFCLVVARAQGEPEFTIRESIAYGSATAGQWKFGEGRLATETIEILAGGKLIHRSHQSSITTLANPLHILPTGGIENFRFGWARTTRRSKTGYGAVTLAKSLALTNLAGRPVQQSAREAAAARRELLPAFRKQLLEALDDPSLTAGSPGFEVLQTYFEAVGSEAEPEDVELISRLVADPRLTRFPGVGSLKLPIAQLKPIYDSYTRRLLQTGTPMEMQQSLVYQLIDAAGTDAFGLVGPMQEQMLADPVKRLAAPELAKAIGTGEAAEGPRLLSMLRHHAGQVQEIQRQRQSREIGTYGRQTERDANLRMMGNIKSGLCLLGPKAAAIREELEQFLQSGVLPAHHVEGHDMTGWNVILVRMGKPIESIAKAPRMGGTEANYRRNLREKVERWRPDRC